MVTVLDDASVEDNVFRPAKAGAVGEGLLGLGLGRGKGVGKRVGDRTLGVFLHGAAWCMPPPPLAHLPWGRGLTGEPAGQPKSVQLPNNVQSKCIGCRKMMLDGGHQVQRDIDVNHL